MKFLLIQKSNLEGIPPVLSLIIILSELGHKVELITCGIGENNKKFLEEKGVFITELPYLSASRKIWKLYDYAMFRRSVYKFIKSKNPKEYVLIIEGVHTIVSIGSHYTKLGYKNILMLPEYIEGASYQIRAIRNVIGRANCVLVPEYNRCHFYRIKYSLKKMPLLLPNKPYFEPNLQNIDSFNQRYEKEIALFTKKKVILYQGHVAASRDVSAIVQAVKELGGDYQMVVMGKDYGVVEKYKKIDANIIHIPFIPAPDYLNLTHLAYIGILMYDPLLMNTAYCAPNKIFEYTKFGLPIIGNDIPGIYYPVNLYNFGKAVDFSNIELIKNAIIDISDKYQKYSANAINFYNSVDNISTIRNMIETL